MRRKTILKLFLLILSGFSAAILTDLAFAVNATENLVTKNSSAAYTVTNNAVNTTSSTNTTIAKVNRFETKECLNSEGLSLINAAAAYEQGFTGKGVNIGILGVPVDATNPKLAGKVKNWPNVQGYDDQYATFIAGIVAAKRDGNLVHGVAFDSTLSVVDVMVESSKQYDAGNIFSVQYLELMKHSEPADIFINSWSHREEPASVIASIAGEGTYNQPLYSFFDTNYDQVAAIWATDQTGCFYPKLPAFVPYFDRDGHLSNHLVVGEINSKSLTDDGAGNLTAPPFCITMFSNLPGKVSVLYSIMAPGSNILSIVKAPKNFKPSLTKDGFIISSGSYASAGFAGGALALVKQKYPFLNARQLVDTVLTTANKDFIAPDYIVTFKKVDYKLVKASSFLGQEIILDLDPELYKELMDQEYFDEANKISALFHEMGVEDIQVLGGGINGEIKYYFVFRVLNQDMKLPETTEEAKQLLAEYFDLDPKSARSCWPADEDATDEKIREEMLNFLNSYGSWYAERVTFEEVFGQGILDAGKAINGVARLDANRLRKSDVSDVYRAALDVFNLPKDQVAWFDNDISERRWNDHYHPWYLRSDGEHGDMARVLADLPVGLRKSGAGSLGLRGHNTFTGPIVVASGTLMLEPRLDGTGGIVESKVIVKKGATFKGEGKVNELSNSGTVKIDFALKLNKFVQKASGTLHLTASGDDWGMRVKEANLAGTLVLESENENYPAEASAAKLAFIPEASEAAHGEFDHVKVYSNHQLRFHDDFTKSVAWQPNLTRPQQDAVNLPDTAPAFQNNTTLAAPALH